MCARVDDGRALRLGVFVDQAIIQVRAGKGGDGAVSFRREKFEAKGGPDGGNGGDGGSVLLVADEGMSTLYDFRHQFKWYAEQGENGGRKQCSGKQGKDLPIHLPPGTLLYNNKTGEVLHDLKPGETVVLAKGGRGGFGNEHFKRSDYQVPKESEPGEQGQEFEVRLELKLIAEVGFVGMPNAGKSTLLGALTKASPKIGSYPFTTLSPQLGVAEVDMSRRLVLADIPGLIEGASEGAGLGHDFLRHVERTKTIVHLLDLCPLDESDPVENYRTIRAELKAYSPALAEKPELVVANKIDLFEDENERKAAIKRLARELNLREGKDLIAISGGARMNLSPLMEKLWALVHPGSTAEAAGEGWKRGAAVGSGGGSGGEAEAE